MKKQCTVSWLIGVVLLLAVGCGQSQGLPESSSSAKRADQLKQGETAKSAPAWELVDANGDSVQFGGPRERPVILLFWATWCPYCKQLMPHLQSIVDEYGGGIEVLALNVFEDADSSAFLDEYGYEFRLVPSADAVAPAYGVKGTPGLFLVDRQGRIRYDLAQVELDKEIPSDVKRWQKAARLAPLWAAELRKAIDQLP